MRGSRRGIYLIGYTMSRIPERLARLFWHGVTFVAWGLAWKGSWGSMALHIGELPKIATILRYKQNWTLAHTDVVNNSF
jgi:hypothetical protein